MSVKDFENERWRYTPQKLEFRHRAALSLVEKGPVLDVGCGDGLFLSLCKDRGIEAQGVDFSDVAVARCKERGLDARQADLAAGPLPFPDKSFPTVIALDVLEHVYEPEKLLQEMKRISSGAVIVGVPNFSSLPARLQVLLGKVPENNRPNKAHVYWFNWSVLLFLAKRAGLIPGRLEMNTFSPLTHFSWAVPLWPNLLALSFVLELRK